MPGKATWVPGPGSGRCPAVTSLLVNRGLRKDTFFPRLDLSLLPLKPVAGCKGGGRSQAGAANTAVFISAGIRRRRRLPPWELLPTPLALCPDRVPSWASSHPQDTHSHRPWHLPAAKPQERVTGMGQKTPISPEMLKFFQFIAPFPLKNS